MVVDNQRIVRWLESVQVVRVSKLEREETTPGLTTLVFRDNEGSIHTVSVNPDGTPREYKDPKGHVHQYNTRYKPPARTEAPATAKVPITTTPAAEPRAAPTVAKATQAPARLAPEAPPKVAVAPVVQPQQVRTLASDAKAPATATSTPPTPPVATPPPTAARPPKAGGGNPPGEEKKGLEEIVIEWAESNHGVSGASILRREISTKGITFRLKGPDGAEYEAVTGMDRQVKSFRKV